MTISSTTRKAGPYVGNGVTTVFAFAFKVFAKEDVYVVRTLTSTGVETALVLDDPAGYTVTLNADQDANPGGSITYNPSGVPLPSTQELTITSAVAQLQSLALTVGGGFFPQAIANALDRAVILIQQLTLTAARALKVGTTEDEPLNLPPAVERANHLLGFDSTGEPIAADSLAGAAVVSSAMEPVIAASTLALARAALGSTTVGDAVFVAANAAAARSALSALGTTAGEVAFLNLANKVAGHPGQMINGNIAASRSGSAETFAVKTLAGNDPSSSDPVYFTFRNTSGGSDDVETIALTAALTLTISNGSTLGASASTPFRVWIVAFNDAGTLRLGAVNSCVSNGVINLRPDLFYSSTAEGGVGGADTAGTIYTGTAVASKAICIAGYIEYSMVTPGTWNTAPSKRQVFMPGVPLPGDVVQWRYASSSASATSSTTIPSDDTIPQSSEGGAFGNALDVAISTTSGVNFLRWSCDVALAASAAVEIIVGMWRDAATDASFATSETRPLNGLAHIHAEFTFPAVTAGATTLKFRAGGDAASNIVLNGDDTAATRMFGGVSVSYTKIEEIMR